MKNMYLCQIPLFLLWSIFLIGETSSSVSSEKAFYNGNTLTLQGNVEVQHALGKMFAGFAKLIKENKSSSFSFIQLKEDVMISLNNRGEISCETADLDFTTYIGKLFPKAGETIHFTNVFAFQKNAPLSIESDHAEIKFYKEGQRIYITEAFVKDHVVIHFAKDIYMTTNQATFQEEKNISTRIFADSPCHITHFEDQIDAEKVAFHPLEAKILFLHPEGILKSFGDEKKAFDFIFSADHGEVLCSEEEGKTTFTSLLLKGNVQLSRSYTDTSCLAAADQLSYFPKIKTAILSAEEGNHVLFWDADQDLSISAPEVLIKHEEHKNTIKGLGVVRFVFSSYENSLLKKLFPFYEPSGVHHE